MAVVQDLTVYKNEDIKLKFTNVQKPISGWTIVLTIRKKPTTVDPAIIQHNAAITDASLGTYEFVLSSAELTIKADDYYYDVQRTDAAAVAVLSIGKFKILQEVRKQ